MTRAGTVLLVSAAVLACTGTPDSQGGPTLAPVTTGAIRAIVTVNALPLDCEVAGGRKDVLVDGAEGSPGWFDGEWVLVGVAPGIHQVTARCTSCDGVVLGESRASVSVLAGAISEAHLDIEAPPAQGSLVVTWDTSGCVGQASVSTQFAENPTCRFASTQCENGSLTLTNLLPGTYALLAMRPDPLWPGVLAPLCACRVVARDVVVPFDPVPVGSTTVGPLAFVCGGWCP